MHRWAHHKSWPDLWLQSLISSPMLFLLLPCCSLTMARSRKLGEWDPRWLRLDGYKGRRITFKARNVKSRFSASDQSSRQPESSTGDLQLLEGGTKREVGENGWQVPPISKIAKELSYLSYHLYQSYKKVKALF